MLFALVGILGQAQKKKVAVVTFYSDKAIDLSEVDAQRHFTLKYVIDAYNNTTDKSKFFQTSREDGC